MPRMVSRIVRWMSRSACVVTSPMTTHSPFVIALSHATRACGSCASMPSSTASETWSHTLSGWPSVTDSEVRRKECEDPKELATTTANDIGPSCRCAGGDPPEPARATVLAAQRCRRAHDRYACLRGDGLRSLPRFRGGDGARCRAAHLRACGLAPGRPPAIEGSGRAQAAAACAHAPSPRCHVPMTSTRPAAVTRTFTSLRGARVYEGLAGLPSELNATGWQGHWSTLGPLSHHSSQGKCEHMEDTAVTVSARRNTKAPTAPALTSFPWPSSKSKSAPTSVQRGRLGSTGSDAAESGVAL